MATDQWGKWMFDSYALGQNSPPPVSSNNAIINPAPNTSQQSFAPTAPPVVPMTPKAPTTYIPKTPSVPSATPAPAPVASTPIAAPTYPLTNPINTVNSQGLTPAGMSALAEQQMKDRVIGASKDAPGTLQTGAQMGKLPDGTPVTFQAYTYGNGKTPEQINTETRAGGSVGVTGQSSMATTAESEKLVYDPAQGGYVKPDTSAIDKKLEEYYDPNRRMSDIQAELEATKQGIWADYNNDLRNAMRDFENRNKEQFSNLAKVGSGINPLSSAGQSVANGNELLFNRFKEGLDAERNARIAIAEKTARGEKADAEMKYIEYLTNQRKDMLQEAEDNYNRYQSEQESALNRLYKSRQIAAMDREVTMDERDDIRNTMETIFKLQGSMAFSDIPEAEMRAMEEKAGYPAGFIKSTIEGLRKEEEAAKLEASKPIFKQAGSSIMQYVLNPETGQYDMVQQDRAEDLKTIGKSVYQITYDEAGNPKMTLVPGSPTTPVGGSGGGTGTDASGLPKGFTTTTQKTLENLATGKMNWGSAFDSVKALYPQVDNNLIDTFLNKERWSAPGAYEIKKQSEFKSDGSSDYETVF